MVFIGYPNCSTSNKAQKWLDDHGLAYEYRNIKDENPTAEEIKTMHEKSGLPLKRFYNTSGLLYKSMRLKDQILNMTVEEQYELLSSDGMLVKRPIVLAEDFVLVGFKENEWEIAMKEAES